MEVTSVVFLLDEDRFRIEVDMTAMKVFVVLALVFCCSSPTNGKVESKVSQADNFKALQSYDFLPAEEFIEDSSGG